MEELQGYPVADDKEIRDAHNKAISLIEHNVDEFFDCFPGANSENNFYIRFFAYSVCFSSSRPI